MSVFLSRVIDRLIRGDGRPALASPWARLAIALLPAILAIWCVPNFVTQDGPAHLYNAHILSNSLRDPSAFGQAYAIRWEPLPNWGGHILAMAFDLVLPPRSAERLLTTTTLIALAAPCFSLRRSVAGAGGEWTAACLSTLLALNVTWLLGFTSFLLGAMLFPITLQVWWGGKDSAQPSLALKLGTLLIASYFCHPIGLGLTIFGLVILDLFTPRTDYRRTLWTLCALVPLVPLGLVYLSLTAQGGPMQPIWEKVGSLLDPRSWSAQLGWVDPITLSGKMFRPFSTATNPLNPLLAPVIWLALGLALLLTTTRRAADPRRRPWFILAFLLIPIGVVSPDTLGINHGHYLPQRIVLLGLVALVPVLDFSGSRLPSRFGRGAIVGALVIQSLWVWDYALECSRNSSSFMTAASAVGRGNRVGTVLADVKSRFRSNPMLHLDCLFGIDTGNVIWSNYETGFYYFPVQLRRPDSMPPSSGFEEVARLVGQGERSERARRWSNLLDRYRPSIDVVFSWGEDREIDRINSDRFARCVVSPDRRVRIWSGEKTTPPTSRELDLSRIPTATQPRR